MQVEVSKIKRVVFIQNFDLSIRVIISKGLVIGVVRVEQTEVGVADHLSLVAVSRMARHPPLQALPAALLAKRPLIT